MPLDPDAGWAPDLSAAPRDNVAALYLNYPSNPCAACVPDGTFEAAIDFAEQTGAAVMHDFAYGDLVYDGRTPRSFLATPGAREVGVELFSFSKSYGMAGWRLGFALGNAELVARLNLMNDHVRAGIFRAVQEAGIAALTGPAGLGRGAPRRSTSERRDRVFATLAATRATDVQCEGTFFVWFRLPDGVAADDVLESHRVALAPGEGFGADRQGLGADLARDARRAARPRPRAARGRVRLKQAATASYGSTMLRGVVAVGSSRRSVVVPAASAKTYKVTTRSDHAPGACTANDCTLREAVIAANGTLTTPDTVVLPSTKPYKLTIAGTDEDGAMTGDLDITNSRLRIVHQGKGRATWTATRLIVCSRCSWSAGHVREARHPKRERHGWKPGYGGGIPATRR